MSVLTLYVDEVMRTLSDDGRNPFVVNDKEVDVVRFALNTGFTDVVLDEHSALRVMYQRPGESQVRAQTLTYYDTDGLRNYYDWQLLNSDLAKKGTITCALCILRTDSTVEEWHTIPYQIRVLGSIHTDDSDEADETITPTVAQRVAVLETMIQRVASGAPIVVTSTSAMTDTEKIYVLKTDGKWYYYDGSAWVAGGTYGAVATDSTLTQSGIPADAKTVGDAINAVTSDVEEVQDALEHLDVETDKTLSVDGKPADAKAVGDIVNPMRTATDSDTGKALKAKTIADGKVTEWEFGEAGGLNPQAVTLLVAILEAGVYTSDQSQHIQDLIIALGGRPVTVEKVGRTLVFSNVDAISSIAQSGTTLVCA